MYRKPFAKIAVFIWCDEEDKEKLEELANEYDKLDLARQLKEYTQKLLSKVPELYIE